MDDTNASSNSTNSDINPNVERKKSYRWVSATKVNYSGSDWDDDDDDADDDDDDDTDHLKSNTDQKNEIQQDEDVSYLPPLPKISMGNEYNNNIVNNKNTDGLYLEPVSPIKSNNSSSTQSNNKNKNKNSGSTNSIYMDQSSSSSEKEENNDGKNKEDEKDNAQQNNPDTFVTSDDDSEENEEGDDGIYYLDKTIKNKNFSSPSPSPSPSSPSSSVLNDGNKSGNTSTGGYFTQYINNKSIKRQYTERDPVYTDTQQQQQQQQVIGKEEEDANEELGEKEDRNNNHELSDSDIIDKELYGTSSNINEQSHMVSNEELNENNTDNTDATTQNDYLQGNNNDNNNNMNSVSRTSFNSFNHASNNSLNDNVSNNNKRFSEISNLTSSSDLYAYSTDSDLDDRDTNDQANKLKDNVKGNGDINVNNETINEKEKEHKEKEEKRKGTDTNDGSDDADADDDDDRDGGDDDDDGYSDGDDDALSYTASIVGNTSPNTDICDDNFKFNKENVRQSILVSSDSSDFDVDFYTNSNMHNNTNTNNNNTKKNIISDIQKDIIPETTDTYGYSYDAGIKHNKTDSSNENNSTGDESVVEHVANNDYIQGEHPANKSIPYNMETTDPDTTLQNEEENNTITEPNEEDSSQVISKSHSNSDTESVNDDSSSQSHISHESNLNILDATVTGSSPPPVKNRSPSPVSVNATNPVTGTGNNNNNNNNTDNLSFVSGASESYRSNFIQETNDEVNIIRDADGNPIDASSKINGAGAATNDKRVVSTYSEVGSTWNAFPAISSTDDINTIADNKTIYDNSTIYNVPGLVSKNTNLPPLPVTATDDIKLQQEQEEQPLEKKGETEEDPHNITNAENGRKQSYSNSNTDNSNHSATSNFKINDNSKVVLKISEPDYPSFDVNKLIGDSKIAHSNKLKKLKQYSDELTEYDTHIAVWIDATLKSTESKQIFDEYKVNKHVHEAYSNADELSKRNHLVSNTVANVNQNVHHLTKKVFKHSMREKSKGFLHSISKKKL
ncbi:Fyv8p SCDLUD_004454 [Saccharomycodes ludwigii]|uniref:Fyv8p n=1 Tax=Saccharomycodes ludwigii TaxID=36035 RepID=UPI001E8A4058|nr:hypothetical protein SCDLUD_004454 [Saccharomycodes ludwigii]KAH3899032.1 hypothetical protein SCDLUD_004454 [Saccharomycodes ludwigii]